MELPPAVYIQTTWTMAKLGRSSFPFERWYPVLLRVCSVARSRLQRHQPRVKESTLPFYNTIGNSELKWLSLEEFNPISPRVIQFVLSCYLSGTEMKNVCHAVLTLVHISTGGHSAWNQSSKLHHKPDFLHCRWWCGTLRISVTPKSLTKNLNGFRICYASQSIDRRVVGAWTFVRDSVSHSKPHDDRDTSRLA